MFPKLPGNHCGWRVVAMGRVRGQLWKQAKAESEKVLGATLKDWNFVLKAGGNQRSFSCGTT